ncbi:MAG TPA: SusC/RagA family TonB-linked outer membrane protein, partial [Sphingobacterium sp.]|nr:SusC/RagA family TonB-linked outer membrane protein [Sphingobacterium sp.]
MRTILTKLIIALIAMTGMALSLNPLYGAGTKNVSSSRLAVQQQDIQVVGSVRDSTGALLQGISVAVKGQTSIGTTTDQNGRFVLAGLPRGAVLIFSRVGYKTQEIILTNAERQEINITFGSHDEEIEEVVVTGFGQRVKRTDMIGSITSVKPQDLKVSSSNLTSALAGRVAGMIAYQRSGEPGMDNADFFIRGGTTFGYKVDPLFLIDNMEVTTTDLARLSVDDIAAFSILKDATATSLYGARGANGVILISTKQGYDGKTALDFRLENSISAPTRNVELADPVTYMKLHNEAILTRNPRGALLYLPEKIDNTGRPGADPYQYPAVDWRSELLKQYTSNQRAHLNVRGGGTKADYYVSGSVNRDNGLLRVPKENNFNNNINLTSYSLRSNVNMNLTKTTQLTVRLSGNFDDYSGPLQGGAETYAMIMRANPVLFAPRYPAQSAQRGLN